MRPRRTSMKYGYCCFVAIASTVSALGQGTFRNLDFESASLPILPPGQGAFASAGDAFPFWQVYLGDNLQSTVGYNALSIGGAAVSILGPNFNQFQDAILEGSFTAALAAGAGSSSASLRQMGTVPIDAQSLRVLIPSAPDSFQRNFNFALNGVTVAMLPVSVGPTITEYGGDVTAFAGLTLELSISAYLSPAAPTFFGFRLDDIQFSNQAIPEPSLFGLFALGALLLGLRILYTRR